MFSVPQLGQDQYCSSEIQGSTAMVFPFHFSGIGTPRKPEQCDILIILAELQEIKMGSPLPSEQSTLNTLHNIIKACQLTLSRAFSGLIFFTTTTGQFGTFLLPPWHLPERCPAMKTKELLLKKTAVSLAPFHIIIAIFWNQESIC